MAEFNYFYDVNDPAKPFLRHCPANKGSLPPANAVRVAPPEAAPGRWPCLGPDGWASREDHRGEIGYLDGSRTEIKLIGPYPDGWSAEPPPPSEEEEKAKAIGECLAALAGLDAKSTRALRAIEALRARIDAGEAGLGAELEAELAFLTHQENQARDERAKLAALNGVNHGNA